MKKTLLSLVTILCYISNVFAQDTCSKYYPFEEGTSLEYTVYNKKDKADGTTTYKVEKVSREGDTTIAAMNLTFTDGKGKSVYNNDYKISCSGDKVQIDYKSLFPAQMMKQYKDMNVEMDITGSDIIIPNLLTVGQELPDANVIIEMKMGIKMKITVNTTNRKVISEETITTPAGTFNCMIMTETVSSKVMGSKNTSTSKAWVAEGVGLVKQETYNKKGALSGRFELTKVSK